MKTIIYYFTGTGNSLWTARKLAEKLPDSELIPIAKVWETGRLTPQSETIGLVFPMYFQGTPDIVLRFAEKLVLDDISYIFAICTRGVTRGIVFKQLNRILASKDKRLNFASYLTMPDNYIVNFNAPRKEHAHKVYARAENRLDKIAGIIESRKETASRDPLIGSILGSISYSSWIKDLHEKDRDFWTDQRCNSCGTCVKVCPVDNVELVDGKPSWLHHCQQCFACIHLCPEESIQIGKRTLKRTRYRHPEIKLKEIIDQKG